MVRLDAKGYRKAHTKADNVISIATLKAGMLVSAEVKKILPNGIFVQFLDYFTGTIDSFHLGCSQYSDITTKFQEGNKVRPSKPLRSSHLTVTPSHLDKGQSTSPQLWQQTSGTVHPTTHYCNGALSFPAG